MIRKKMIGTIALAASISLLSIPLSSQATVENKQDKTFSVSGGGTGSARVDINNVGTVYTSAVTTYSGTHSKLTATNTSALNGKKGSPTTGTASSSSNKAVTQQNLGKTDGGAVYEVWGSHSVYVGGVYKGGTTTHTNW